jgi:FAD/FMN-containing dehydrogenase
MSDSEQRQTDYQTRKARVIAEAQRLLADGHKLALGKKTSNLFRNRKRTGPRIDVSDFNHVLHVDTENLIVEVEGMTPFATLVEETLKYGCLPTVVPELKSITVGGGLTGVAIESSSFRYGLVHETIVESEIMLSDGSVVTCTADNEYSDLFFSFPNTYGSLGYALKVKMKLIRAKPFVKLTHLHFDHTKALFSRMKEECQANRAEGSKFSYIDAMALSEHDLHLTLGEFVDTAPYTSNYQFMNIYYRSIAKRDQDYLTASDYIWRWDTDWFWCSKNFGMQNMLFRLLLGKWMLGSVRFWKIMHFARNSKMVALLEKWFSKPKETVIQDIEVPIENAPAFHHFFHQQIKIKPVWMCPVQTLNPKVKYHFYHMDPTKIFVNFGFWEAIESDHKPGYYNRLIETEVTKLSGHKSLYSDVFYTEHQFWQLYDKTQYQQIKAKYDAKGGLKEWYQKVTGK